MKKIIIGNWKLNLTHLEGIQLLQKINYSLQKDTEEYVEVVLAPSFTSLRSIQTVISTDKLKIKLSSQDVSRYSEGAYTGEVSANQLLKLSVDYCIVGHSERREYFHETDEIVNEKVLKLLDSEIVPIFCFGESLQNREQGNYLDYIKNQINTGLKNVRKDKVNKLVLAYEPIWAIGTGNVATIDNIIEVLEYVKVLVSEKSFFSEENILLIYGGSVSPDNASEILNTKIVNGALVGGASLDSDKFVKIINSISI
ncbi:MAG: triose-phosphate isomerase [Actinomycetota bacterium]|nr:triose-phosphate isomerase [Actinomycetota bacterium]MDA3012990.1 triose-phosphate isomerase [Actinomycetota bacterium]